MAEHKCEPVAWRCTQRIPDDGARFDCVASNADYVRVHDKHNWEPLHTAAQLAEEVERARAEERALAVAACMAFANDLRNHDVVRMTAAKCAGAVSVAAIRTADDGAQHG